MLILYYPFFNESDLKLNNSYLLKNNSLGVLNIVNRNREIFEPASDNVDHYWVQIICKIEAKQNANCCLLLQVKLLILSLQILLNLATSAFRLQHLNQSVDDVSLVNSLIVKQRAVFIVVVGCPVDIYMFSVTKRNTRTRCEICSKLTIKTPEQRQASFWRLYC